MILRGIGRLATALAAMVLSVLVSGSLLAQEAFPVSIDHAFGETTIEDEPERIVTIGWMSQDTVLALGVLPVGIPYTSWGGNTEGYYPWVKEAVEELGLGAPAQLNFDNGIPFEEILSLEPDVIIARYSGLTDEEYARLSTIAPTIAYADQPWSGNWRDITRVVGTALGQSDRAESLVAETEAYIAQQRSAHPEFEGNTFLFAGSVSEGIGQLAVYVSTDPRVQLIEDLGLTLAEGVKALPIDQGFNIAVSLENLGSVEADILFAWHPDAAGETYVRTHDLLSRFRPVAEGRYVPIIDRSFVMATSAPSPLSIPWSLETLVPEIAAVLQ
ncbi:iron-siderophore ABC transporter substrate-binding protein [Pelagibacterium sp.]|uniref:iron-siderophore ABC transporter substrate-binding protein n=1 Tax=Pelagibacterium sp. TaxID=1967288 RepID=UPI003A8D816E